MSLRKWLVRGLVFTVVGGLAAAAFVYQRWTNPTAVRRQVLAKIILQFPGAAPSLDSAHMRLFGGIALGELRLVRRDDPDRNELAYIPSAVVYPDKEHLLDGKVGLRKVELYGARFHVIRGRDGRWNVAGILGPVDLKVQIPTIVIDQGTILIEDRLAAPGRPPVELKNVHLTLMNDPRPTLNFKGTALSALAGALQVAGSYQRPSDDTVLSIDARKIPVGPALVGRMRPYCEELARHVRHLEGTGTLRAKLEYHPGTRLPWTHDIHWDLTGGKVSHPDLPLALDHLEASLSCCDGRVTVENLSARAGPAEVKLEKAYAEALRPDTNLGGTLTVAHLPVSREHLERIPALKKIGEDYHPTGPVSLGVQFRRTAGRWYKHFVIKPEDMRACCSRFEYPLEHVQGTIDQLIDPAHDQDVLSMDLVAYGGSRPVSIKGTVVGSGPTCGVDVKIAGENIPLDEKVRKALREEHRNLADQFHPTAGLADFEAVIRRTRGNTEFDNRYLIHFHDAVVRYALFPYPLEGVAGVLEILPDHWEFRDFRGTHHDGEIRTSGRSIPGAEGDRLRIKITGRRLALDSDLEAALTVRPELQNAWKMFTPSGHMDFVAEITGVPHQHDPDIDVTVTPTGCTVKPVFFPYELNHLTGKSIHYSRGRIDLNDLRAEHGGTVMTLGQGQIVLAANGVGAEIKNLQGSPLVPDEDLLQALPAPLRAGCKAVELKDPLRLRLTTLKIDSTPKKPSGDGVRVAGGTPEPEAFPDIYWDGQLELQNAAIFAGVPLSHLTGVAACRGRYNGRQMEDLRGNILLDELTVFNQPFRQIQTQVGVAREAPSVVMFPGFSAHIFGGEVNGPVRVDFGTPLTYELNLTASQIKMEEFGAHNLGQDHKLSGLATAQLFLKGEGADAKNLRGHGNVHVPKGRLYNLPLLLDLLKVLGLHLPDGTAFEEAHANFTISGQRVAITRFDLFGYSISLRGQGEVNLDGSDINLDFYAVWARVTQLLPPVIKEIPQAISKQLFKIKMRGRVGDVRCTKEPVPVLVEPLKELLQAMSGRGS